MAQETIRHKEIIIKLLKSGSLDDRQLRAILPPGKTISLFGNRLGDMVFKFLYPWLIGII